ncbi:cytochrome P450 4C1-like isoform X3 [Phymastichus coffea]|uniref:cytochrome P450 4C1-like isoform X3 n=1 Tax=Phymastichus coffea TaxID=108790 RepID=UPI00273B44B2|nr:cytochrome P450 4C1-like isoform X3 [Phymastichus coffea]
MINTLLRVIQILLIVIAAVCVKYLVQYFYMRYRFRNIPGVTGMPFLGVAWDLLKVPIEDQQEWFSNITNKYKNSIFVLWIGPRPFINLQQPRHMEAILPSTVNIKKSFVYDLVTPWLGNGLLTSTGEKWFHQRKLLTPAFYFGVLGKFTDLMYDKVKILNDCIENHVFNNSNEPVEIFDFISKCTLDIICETAMGVEMDAQRKKADAYFKAVHEFSNLVSDRYIKPWYMWDFFYSKTKDGRKLKKTIEIMHEFTTGVITEKLAKKKNALPVDNTDDNENDDFVFAGKKKCKAFLDILLEASENDSQPLSVDEIREQVDTFTFAGHDTTATAICWTLFALGNEPEIQNNVRKELRNVFDGDNYNSVGTKLMQLKYLDCVIKETLRLYPSAPFIFRDLSEDVTFAGTSLTINIFDLHRDDGVWENPLDFNPDRFLTSNMIGRHPYSYLPFSAGPRNCIGQRFAFLELKVVLSSFLSKWQIKSAKSPKDIKLQTDIILRCFEPIKLYLTPVIN